MGLQYVLSWYIIRAIYLYARNKAESYNFLKLRSLTLREEHRLRVFENRVLRRIFGPWKDEVKRDWRTLHNEELHNLYFLPNIIRLIKSRRMRWVVHVARMGQTRNAYRILVGKPEGKRRLGRRRRRWVDNIKMDLRETGWDGMDWIDVQGWAKDWP
jgi:hypothetical protein